MARAAESERRHVDAVAVAVVRQLRADRADRIRSSADTARACCSMRPQLKTVVSGRHRRVGREHGCGRHVFQRSGERSALRHLRMTALDDLKGRVTFVQMPYGRLDAECAQRANAADTEHDLLHHARRFVAAVQPMRDGTVGVADSRAGRCRADTGSCDRRGPARYAGAPYRCRSAPRLRCGVPFESTASCSGRSSRRVVLYCSTWRPRTSMRCSKNPW